MSGRRRGMDPRAKQHRRSRVSATAASVAALLMPRTQALARFSQVSLTEEEGDRSRQLEQVSPGELSHSSRVLLHNFHCRSMSMSENSRQEQSVNKE